MPPGVGCSLVVAAPIQTGPNEWQGPVYRDLGNAPTPPLFRSALRVGVETPRGTPLVRATVGSGLIWSTSRSPFEAATIGIGSRGKFVRFYTELEAGVARVRVSDTRVTFHRDSVVGLVPDSRTTTAVVLQPGWMTLHVGAEFSLAAR
jgi:hypothetical protein